MKLVTIYLLTFTLIFLSTLPNEAFAKKQLCDLCQAVEANNLDSAKLIVKDKSKLSELNDKEIWPLFIAIAKENTKMVQLLIDAGVDVNQTVNGMSALIGTVMDNSPNMAKMLIEAGANPNIQSMPDNSNAIHLAAGQSKSEVLKELLKGKVDLELKTTKGFTALLAAAANENREVVNILLEAGADPNYFDPDNLTPMHMIVMSKDVSLIDLMIKHGGDINAQKNNGLTRMALS